MQSATNKTNRQSNEPIWITALVAAVLSTLFYVVEAYAMLLAGVYGMLLAEVYNRSDFGKRIQAFLKGRRSK